MTTPQTVKTNYVQGESVTYAYRIFGKSNESLPLLILHHFRASIDHWDPLFISSLASQRKVILFDNAGVGKSTGSVPGSIKAMADHVADFLAALKRSQIDLYGFSIGGNIAQQLVLDHPNLVRKLILSGTGPGVGSQDPHIGSPNAASVAKLASVDPDLDSMTRLFFYPSEISRAAAADWWGRIQERTKESSGEERSSFVTGAGFMAQLSALKKWKSGEGLYGRLDEVKCPELITN